MSTNDYLVLKTANPTVDVNIREGALGLTPADLIKSIISLLSQGLVTVLYNAGTKTYTITRIITSP